MKRLIVFIIISALLCVLGSGVARKLTISELFPNSEVEVYVDDEIIPSGLSYIKNGSGNVIFCDMEDLNYIKENCRVAGFTVKARGYKLEDIINKLMPNTIFEQMGYIYGQSNFFGGGISFMGMGINFQCAEVGGCVLIGSPILLGGY